MAQLKPEKIDFSTINNGQEYVDGDGVSASTINGALKASSYAQHLATNTPYIIENNEIGEASVEIATGADGTPRLAFKNLKGKKGDSGLDYGASLSNEVGNSDTNGYTQAKTNSLISNPNLLINGTFEVWQRGTEIFTYEGVFSADRWWCEIGASQAQISKDNDGLFISCTKSTPTYMGIVQKLETTEFIKSQTVTLSFMVKSSYECYGLIRYKNPSGTNTTISRTNKHTGDGTWQLLSVTVNLASINPSNISEIAVKFQSELLSQFSATIKYAKLEIGEIATSLSPRPYAEELAMCQRYYQLKSSSFIFATSELDRSPVMRVSGTVGETTINSITYNYCDSEIY